VVRRRHRTSKAEPSTYPPCSKLGGGLSSTVRRRPQFDRRPVHPPLHRFRLVPRIFLDLRSSERGRRNESLRTGKRSRKAFRRALGLLRRRPSECRRFFRVTKFWGTVVLGPGALAGARSPVDDEEKKKKRPALIIAMSSRNTSRMSRHRVGGAWDFGFASGSPSLERREAIRNPPAPVPRSSVGTGPEYSWKGLDFKLRVVGHGHPLKSPAAHAVLILVATGEVRLPPPAPPKNPQTHRFEIPLTHYRPLFKRKKKKRRSRRRKKGVAAVGRARRPATETGPPLLGRRFATAIRRSWLHVQKPFRRPSGVLSLHLDLGQARVPALVPPASGAGFGCSPILF